MKYNTSRVVAVSGDDDDALGCLADSDVNREALPRLNVHGKVTILRRNVFLRSSCHVPQPVSEVASCNLN